MDSGVYSVAGWGADSGVDLGEGGWGGRGGVIVDVERGSDVIVVMDILVQDWYAQPLPIGIVAMDAHQVSREPFAAEHIYEARWNSRTTLNQRLRRLDKTQKRSIAPVGFKYERRKERSLRRALRAKRCCRASFSFFCSSGNDRAKQAPKM